jgi:hypothetical protein
MSVDVHEQGVRVALSILEILDEVPVIARWAPTARLTVRGSTAVAPVLDRIDALPGTNSPNRGPSLSRTAQP